MSRELSREGQIVLVRRHVASRRVSSWNTAVQEVFHPASSTRINPRNINNSGESRKCGRRRGDNWIQTFSHSDPVMRLASVKQQCRVRILVGASPKATGIASRFRKLPIGTRDWIGNDYGRAHPPMHRGRRWQINRRPSPLHVDNCYRGFRRGADINDANAIARP